MRQLSDSRLPLLLLLFLLNDYPSAAPFYILLIDNVKDAIKNSSPPTATVISVAAAYMTLFLLLKSPQVFSFAFLYLSFAAINHSTDPIGTNTTMTPATKIINIILYPLRFCYFNSSRYLTVSFISNEEKYLLFSSSIIL